MLESPITPLTLTRFEKIGVLAKTVSYTPDLCREELVLGKETQF
ncbi:hypothetical protein [cyanobacterium endosymbiont of Rhopalodia gibberula]|nr:hypothetical protein [cyanobacterium endosymbiont of Rhopalodia gibberula]